jgi:hypothetical protein
LIEENAAGRIISSVARTPTGEIAGHDAVVLLDPASQIYENAAGAVSSTFRGQGVFFQLLKHTIQGTADRFGVKEILGEPVCNHLHLQKMCLQLDYKETGLEVDLMPEAAYTREGSATGRVSVLMGYFRHRPRPLKVYLPPVYRDQIAFLYSGLGLERAFAGAIDTTPMDKDSQGSIDIFASAQVARIAVSRIGSDFEDWLGPLETGAQEKNVSVFQVWLPLTSPFTAEATDVLRAHGYFIGGMLPNRPGGDGLLMQKVSGEIRWERIAFYSERAKQIGEMVKSDRDRMRSELARSRKMFR